MLKERLLFTTGDAHFCVADVIAAARHWGDWEVIEGATRERLACLRRAEGEGEVVTAAALDEGVTQWRRARRLISAEETRRWLDERQVSFGDVQRHVHGVLMAEAWADELDATIAGYPVSDEEVGERLYAEGVCSGALGEVARRLAARAAVHAAPAVPNGGIGLSTQQPDWLVQLDEHFERFREGVVTEAAVAKEIDDHQMDWLSVRCQLLAFPRVDAAREAALAVRSDGAALTDVAGRAGTAVEERRLYLEDADPGMRALFLSAREGELIGPLDAEDEHVVVLVAEKAPPSSTDAEVRRRAEAVLVQRAVARAVATNVRRHAGL